VIDTCHGPSQCMKRAFFILTFTARSTTCYDTLAVQGFAAQQITRSEKLKDF